MSLKNVINHSAYTLAVVCVVLLCAWSIVHVYTKQKDGPLFTELHMVLSQLVATCVLLLLVTWLHKSAK